MGPLTRLKIAAALSAAGICLLIAGTAVIGGPGPALLVAGASLSAFGLFGIGVK